MAFTADLFFEETKIKKPKTVANYLSAIRFVLKSHGYDISVFSSISLYAYRSSFNLMYRATHPIADETRLPFTCDMLLFALHNKFNLKTIQHSCIRTAMALAFSCLLRVSEYLGQYAIRCGDISFTVQLLNGQILTLTADQIHNHKNQISKLINVNINIRCSKTDAFGAGFNYFFDAGARHLDSFDIVQILFDHASLLTSNTATSGFFELLGVRPYKLTYVEFNSSIRSVATHFGLPAWRFASHSLRIGGACALLANGASEALIRLMGRWRSLAFLDYLRMTDDAFRIAQSAISNPHTMTSEQVRRLVRSQPAIIKAAASDPESLNVMNDPIEFGDDDEFLVE
jgi:hypothetical protein